MKYIIPILLVAQFFVACGQKPRVEEIRIEEVEYVPDPEPLPRPVPPAKDSLPGDSGRISIGQ
ncbi:hypothetical protein MKQ68_05375 [Chitinophaga horti]|uniref:Argininosuccinate lyase n=1 Tax=Chitinophaga horti TaxID=2920382 RepID=A0ABY6J4C3_9BACT|nr:hypothetical protein [Chitinophaga horti]UYQ94520.1 hypothetical protein MKQ68_05375 [Chitinophaga horti]